jgi:multiple sugar transport system ATP-binding protein
VDLSHYAFAAKPVDGTPVSMGLRPEHFTLAEPNGSVPVAIFDLPVRYSEKTGSEGTVFLAAADQLIAVKAEAWRINGLQEGKNVKAHFPKDKISVFDTRSGRRM